MALLDASAVRRYHFKLLNNGAPVWITPQIAETLLTANHSNRPLSLARVRQHVQRIEDGRWLATVDPICLAGPSLSRPERLFNGQHRLTAVVESGVRLPFLVAVNVDESMMATFDTGKSRSAGDILHLHGVAEATNVAAALRVLAALLAGNSNLSGFIISAADIHTLYEEHPTIEESVRICRRPGYPMEPGIMSAVHYLARKQSKAKADEFFNRCIDTLGLTEDHPVYVLRRRLIHDRTGHNGRKARAAWLIKAWDAFRHGTTIERLQFGQDEKFPFKLLGVDK